MSNRKGFFILLVLSSMLCFSIFAEEIHPVIPDELTSLSIDFRPISTDISLRKLQEGNSKKLNEEVAMPDSAKKWNSTVTQTEREAYEVMLQLKDSFTASLDFLPKRFKPENKQYLVDVSKISVIFAALGAFPLFFILVFLFLRFCCKKCVGPTKISQVTRVYRNLTWILMSNKIEYVTHIVLALFFLILVSSFIISNSFKINSAISKSVETTLIETKNIESNVFTDFVGLVDSIKTETSYTIDKDVFNSTKIGLGEYINTTVFRLNDFKRMENMRHLITMAIFGLFLLIIGLSFLGFFKRWENFVLGMSVLLLLTLPALLFFEGITASYYFLYSDLCDNVHDAIYENGFPVADHGLGYYINCFNKNTKASLYSFHYELEEIQKDLQSKLDNEITDSAQAAQLAKIQGQVKNVINTSLNPLLTCSHVYTTIPVFESNFCVSGMNWSKDLISCYSWLFLVIFLLSVAINRLKPLVWKKRVEHDAMIENEEALY